MSNFPFTFQGERGGKAEDADLLAELMAISQGSTSSNRFDAPNDESSDIGGAGSVMETIPESEAKTKTKPGSKGEPKPASRKRASNSIPPWKQKSKLNPTSGESSEVEIVVAAPKQTPKTIGPQYHNESTTEGERKSQHTAFGIKSNLPFTYQGDRGGVAEDADLLAELRAISAKSTRTEKFHDSENNEGGTQVGVSGTIKSPTSEPKIQQNGGSKTSAGVPPWKRKKKPVSTSDTVDSMDAFVHATTPPEPGPEELGVEQSAAQVKTNLPFTFQGDRGGTAEDDDLLAELRSISNQSSSADRFASEDSTESKLEPQPTPLCSERKPRPKPKPSGDIPPWRRKKTVPADTRHDGVDIVITEPTASDIPEPARGLKSDLPFTFQGDRGGNAEDADLLAELRAISGQSSSSHRFESQETKCDGLPAEGAKLSVVQDSSAEPKSSSDLPPWKRKKRIPSAKRTGAVDAVVSGPRPAASAETAAQDPLSEIPKGIKPTLPFTFQGNRGGAAVDADLLAELRAVSAQSKSADRFAEEDDHDDSANAAEPSQQEEFSQSNKADGETSVLPSPRKQKTKPASKVVERDIGVVAPAQVSSSKPPEGYPSSGQSSGIESNLPFTFKGDRGGAAVDADLLAELRAVSSNSSKTDRFDPVEQEFSKVDNEPDTAESSSRVSEELSETAAGQHFAAAISSDGERQEEILMEPKEGIKSNLPFTFKGERGGAAEDADLLAELRAISSKAGGLDRFSSPNEEQQTSGRDLIQHHPPSQPKPVSTAPRVLAEAPPVQASSLPTSASPTSDEIIVTRDSLESSVVDKNWKVRKSSYDLVRQILAERITGQTRPGGVDSEMIMAGLSEAIVSSVCDSNASALDSGLQLAFDYAEHCTNAANSEHAGEIAASLLNGNGLSSSRPSTVKYSSAVLLKLMEVGSEGASSVHEVISMLLEKGLKSRKPKVVLASAKLIHDATLDFGAANLPLASIRTSVPELLSHSNVKVREMGMKIMAEICRAFGSKAPLQEVIDSLKKAQISQLEKMLSTLGDPVAPRVGLRSSQGEEQQDAMEVLEAQAKALEAERFANRKAVNILVEIGKTDFAERLKLPKWSEKVGALDTLLECGGEKPYKLVQPSANVNYAPLVSEMKKTLGHTHFAVVSKAMQVLSMLAEGVGERLYPNLRPMLTTIVQLAKDKKLTKAVGSCLDCLFGNVLSLDHLLDKDDALPSQLDERAQKNALARASTLEYLCRCIQRRESSGKKGALTKKNVESTAKLASTKLADTDAGVRKAAMTLFNALMSLEEDSLAAAVGGVLEGLATSNTRAYKTLKKGDGSSSTTASRKVGNQSASTTDAPKTSRPPVVTKSGLTQKKQAPKEVALENSPGLPKAETSSPPPRDSKPESVPGVEDALLVVADMGIDLWDAVEDDGGVLSGLRSPKWNSRQKAILAIANHCQELEAVDARLFSSVLLLAKTFTKGFKDSNFNIIKAAMKLASILCDKLAQANLACPDWLCMDLVPVATEKIADKKLASDSRALLLDICVVKLPSCVFEVAFDRLEKIRSPVVHEGFLTWIETFCCEFGCKTMLGEVKILIIFLLKECDSSNVKVRAAALAVLGEFHTQLGPTFRAVSLSMCSNTQRSLVEAVYDKKPYDQDASEQERARRCVLLTSDSGLNNAGDAGGGSAIDIPRTDLVAAIGKDCIVKLGAKEGKTAWKLRKEALDEIESALKKCTGLLETSGPQLKSLVDLLRGIRDRLSDSQSNLKPLAARLIGNILGAVEKTAQAKLGKVVYSPLINAAINDNRKPMREASMGALKTGTETSELEGSQPNEVALESLLIAFVGELSDSEFKSAGLPELLLYVGSVAVSLPNIDTIPAARGQPLGDKFSVLVVRCFTSPKSEIRSAAETMLKACIDAGAISGKSVRKGLEKLKPAQQRTVSPLISKMIGTVVKSPKVEKENLPEKREVHRGRTPRPAQTAHQERATPSRPRSSSSRSVVSRSAKPVMDKDFDELDGILAEGGQPVHPLAGSTGTKAKRASRVVTWPEYPEEPSSSNQILSLRKAWSVSLPSKSVGILFPSGGLKKQDDARQGCNLLADAISLDREGSSTFVADQIDLILKWIAAALCSRENTVGLQSLLNLQLSLFRFLGENGNVLTDQESLSIVPFIFEKGSIAKGRFKELFDEVLGTLTSMDVITVKCLGSVVCAGVIEKTSQPKARVMAYNHCAQCVESVGLSGIGKRGLLMTAKKVSEESLPENKAAVLGLIMTILSKMNGDIDRFARMCGTSYLSAKSKDLVEEQWKKKGQNTAQLERQTNSTSVASVEERKTQIPTTRKVSRTSSDRLRTLHGLQRRNAAIGAGGSDDETEETSTLLTSQRTPFALRLGAHPAATKSAPLTDSESTSAGPFTFSFESSVRPVEASRIAVSTNAGRGLGRTSQSAVDSFTVEKSPPHSAIPTGAAASLRARLMKIRQKHTVHGADSEEKPREQIFLKETEKTVEAISESLASDLGVFVPSSTPPGAGSVFDSAVSSFKILCSMPGVINDDQPEVQSSINYLRQFHTSCKDAREGDLLRKAILNDVAGTVAHLTSIIRFAFSRGEPSQNAGMAVSLLSVVLAALMALFRDNTMARLVSQDDLALLIKETGKCLLDPRLAVSATHASGLDESTSSQMVRGMNKLAVHAATGTLRHISLQALLVLQEQLCLFEAPTPAETALNGRLSRIITKLFAKVIKAEESDLDPFSPASVDIPSILCCLEDVLVAVHDRESNNKSGLREGSLSTCRTMSHSLIRSISNSRSADEIRKQLDLVGLSDGSSNVFSVFKSLLPDVVEGRAEARFLPQTTSLVSMRSPSRVSRATSQDVTALVSAVGSAPEGSERTEAINALKRFLEEQGDSELNAHLEEISPTFRAYIVEQLGSTPQPSMAAPSNNSALNLPMSERIKKLRSKINVLESAVSEASDDPAPTTPQANVSNGAGLLSPPKTSRTSSLPSASPGHIASVSSLRQRLVAAQEKRPSAAAPEGEQSPKETAIPAPPPSTSGNAAALRARLQAMKNQNK